MGLAYGVGEAKNPDSIPPDVTNRHVARPLLEAPKNGQVADCLRVVWKELLEGDKIEKKELLWSIYQGRVEGDGVGKDEELFRLKRLTTGSLKDVGEKRVES